MQAHSLGSDTDVLDQAVEVPHAELDEWAVGNVQAAAAFVLAPLRVVAAGMESSSVHSAQTSWELTDLAASGMDCGSAGSFQVKDEQAVGTADVDDVHAQCFQAGSALVGQAAVEPGYGSAGSFQVKAEEAAETADVDDVHAQCIQADSTLVGQAAAESDYGSAGSFQVRAEQAAETADVDDVHAQCIQAGSTLVGQAASGMDYGSAGFPQVSFELAERAELAAATVGFGCVPA